VTTERSRIGAARPVQGPYGCTMDKIDAAPEEVARAVRALKERAA
jgi:hypothetical protein